MNNKILGLIILVIVIIGGIFFFMRRSAAPTETDMAATSDTVNITQGNQGTALDVSGVASSSVTVTAGTAKSFTVTGSNFAFSPKTISVNQGDTVTIHFVNSGGNHNFVIDEFNAKTPVIGSGQSADVTFIASKTGTFEYYCSVGNHRQMGMVGTLTVK